MKPEEAEEANDGICQQADVARVSRSFMAMLQTFVLARLPCPTVTKFCISLP